MRVAWYHKRRLAKAIKAKCHFFHQQGYQTVTEKDLHDYFVAYRWKKQANFSFQMYCEDIARTSINDFFDYQQWLAQTSRFDLESWQQIKDLF